MKYKNIIIIGAPRSGKTTLSKLIVKNINNYNIISLDNIQASFIRTARNKNKFNKLNIIDIIDFTSLQCYNYFMESTRYEEDLNYVLDFGLYNPNIFKLLSKDNLMIFLGYEKLTKEELFNNIRKYDKKNDWTSIESDDDLKFYCEHFLEENKNIIKFAKENGCIFFDTSYNREEVLKNAYNKIIDLLDIKNSNI